MGQGRHTLRSYEADHRRMHVFSVTTTMAVTPFDLPWPKTPRMHANFTALSSIEPELLPTEVLHYRNRKL